MIVDYCDEKLEIKQNLNIEFSNQVLGKKITLSYFYFRLLH